MKNWFLNVAIFLLCAMAYAQNGVITGEVIDGEYNVPLMGANVIVKGTSHGVSTDMDGKYSLNVTAPTGTIEISYLGYLTKAVAYRLVNGKAHLKVSLSSDQQALSEVVVTGKSSLLDIAKERKTPVAVSTIQATEIVEKMGTRELPEILNRTPSVYATKGGGGFGDSSINIRGFDSKNVAVMINGMPVNDMENSRVYFSNWTGLSDVTSGMQVQRGLGASKLAIASVGGTINIVTRAADMSEGGNIFASYGSNGEYKANVSYNTGKSLTGWSTSVLFGKNWGKKYADGTSFEGYNYFLALGYEPSKKHSFQLMFTGASQWHNQRAYRPTIAEAQRYGGSEDQPNRRYNPDWGYLDGEEYSIKKNVYQKPVAMLNWDWNMSESTSLSSVIYASLGRGMGSDPEGYAHKVVDKPEYNNDGTIKAHHYSINRYGLRNLRTEDGLIDFDKAVRYNRGESVEGLDPMQTPGEAGKFVGVTSPNPKVRSSIRQGFIRKGLINSHDWYGFLTNLKHEINKNFTFNMGLDGRYYYAYHHQVVNDLLGNNSFSDESNKNLSAPNIITAVAPTNATLNPFTKVAPISDQITYSNDGEVKWFGIFSQFEYSDDHFSAFIQGATSIQSYQRIDNFVKPGTRLNPAQPRTVQYTKTGFKDIMGYNIKGGVNYNINEQHNVFANTGYYSKQPFFDAVYPNYHNILNPNLTNEKIFGIEAGYGFKSQYFNANVNLYHTSWKDRYESKSNNINVGSERITAYASVLGFQEIHQGIEFEANASITPYLKVNGMFSTGNWYYKGNSKGYLTNESNQPIDKFGNEVPISDAKPFDLFMDGVKVGDSAQQTASLGVTVLPIKGLKIDLDWNYIDNLYARLKATDFDTQAKADAGALKLPAYHLFELGASYKWQLTEKQRLTFSAHAYNLFDTYYISESYSNIHATNSSKTYKGLDVNNQVYFGAGRTFSFGVRYHF
jgi:tonB-dependent receptor